VESGLTSASSTLNPYIQNASRYQNLYDSALGLNGQTASSDVFNNYFLNNDAIKWRDEQTTRALEAQQNARGLGGSGRAALASAEASQRNRWSDINSLLDRYKEQAATGLDTSKVLAQYQYNAGTAKSALEQGRADLNQRLRTAEADRSSAFSTELGRNRSTLATNLGNVLAANASNYGTNVAGVENTYGTDKATLAYGTAQQYANAATNYASAKTAAANTGASNFLSLIGLGTGLATQNNQGVSAFGNIASGLSSGVKSIGNGLTGLWNYS
jgi:hypothetical protein